MSLSALTPTSVKVIKEVVERVEALEIELNDVKSEVKQQFEFAKEKGLNVKAIKEIIKRRRKNKQEIEMEQEVVELYEMALLEKEVKEVINRLT